MIGPPRHRVKIDNKKYPVLRYEDRDKACKDAGVRFISDDAVAAKHASHASCSVCFSNDEETEPLVCLPDCGHGLCETCWERCGKRTVVKGCTDYSAAPLSVVCCGAIHAVVRCP